MPTANHAIFVFLVNIIAAKQCSRATRGREHINYILFETFLDNLPNFFKSPKFRQTADISACNITHGKNCIYDVGKPVLTQIKNPIILNNLRRTQFLHWVIIASSALGLGSFWFIDQGIITAKVIIIILTVLLAIASTIAVHTIRVTGTIKPSASDKRSGSINTYAFDNQDQACKNTSAVCVLDAHNRILCCNQRFSHLTSDPNFVALRPLAQALPGIKDTPFWSALSSKKIWSGEIEIWLQDRTRNVHSVTVIPNTQSNRDSNEKILILTSSCSTGEFSDGEVFKKTLERLNDEVYIYFADTLTLFYMNEAAIRQQRFSCKDYHHASIMEILPELDIDTFRRTHVENTMHSDNETVLNLSIAGKPFEFVTSGLEARGGRRLVVSRLRSLPDRAAIENARMHSVSMISHELRTPLTSIKGALSLLTSGAMGNVGPKVDGILKIAERNSDRLLNVINDILDYEKLVSGDMNFNDGKIELTALVNEALENMKGYSGITGVNLVGQLPCTEAFAIGDGDRLMQVLLNLISNAAKFSPENSEVQVSVKNLGNKWRIAVRDYGPGIPKETISQLGKPFLQLEATRDKKHLGTGLGLTIVKKILAHHDAQLLVTTKEGNGSEFAFELKDVAAELAQNKKTLLKKHQNKEAEHHGA